MTGGETRGVGAEYRWIAFVSDIHGNLPAFQAVLADLPQDSFLVCLGDLVGYYTEPEEVCGLIMRKAHVCLRGNHDAYVIGALSYAEDRDRLYRIAWTRSRISAATAAQIRGLPTSAALELPGPHKILLRHAHPHDEVTYLYPDTPLDDISLQGGTVLAVGHTHHQMLREAGAGKVFNPGSVGQPRDYRPGAQYALLDARSGCVSFRCAPYDIESYQRKLEEQGVDASAIGMLSRSRPPAREVPATARLW